MKFSLLSPFVVVVLSVSFMNGCASATKASASKTDAEQKQALPKAIVFDENLIDRAVLFSGVEKDSVLISPNGKTLVWSKTVEGVANIWTTSVGGPNQPRALTFEKEPTLGSFYFTPDSRSLVFEKAPKSDGNWQLFALDLKKGQVKRLAGEEGVRTEVVALSSKNKRSIVIKINKRDPDFADLYTLNLKTKKTRLLAKNEDFAKIIVDHALKPKLAIRNNDDGSRTLLKKRGRKWRPFYELAEPDASSFSVLGFDARARMAYIIDSTDRNTAALYSLRLRDGKKAELLSDKKNDIERLYLHPRTFKVQGARVEYERPRMIFGDDASFQEHVESLALLGAGSAEIVSRSDDNRKWIVAIEAVDRPLGYFLYDTEEQTGGKLFSSMPQLDGLKFSRTQSMRIPAKDGLELSGYLTLPLNVTLDDKGKALEQSPLVLWVHEGMKGRERLRFNIEHQWLASRGYAVLSINHRASLGFGKDFLNAGDKEWGGKMQDDLLDALNWALEKNITNSERVAIVGEGYGGYAAMHGLAFTPETFACGVNMMGPADLIGLLKEEANDFPERSRLNTKTFGDINSDADLTLLKSRSPLEQGKKIKRPLLYGFGGSSSSAFAIQARQIAEAMQANHVPVTTVQYEDESRRLRIKKNRLSFLALTEVFLAQCLDGKAARFNVESFKSTSMQIPIGVTQISGLRDALDALNTMRPNAQTKASPPSQDAVEKAAASTPPHEKDTDKNQGGETKSGLLEGAQVKLFSLPVLNSNEDDLKRWGPAYFMSGGRAQKKIFIMSFFSTTCAPCIDVLPELVRLNEKYKERGLGTAIVDIEKDDSEGTKRKAALKIIDAQKVSFPLVHDDNQVVGKSYLADTLPYVLVVDASGKVLYSHLGESEDEGRALEAEIRKGLGLSPGE